jgi:hypothetical protein
MVFPVVGGTQDTGYEISNSLRFNGGGDAEDVYLTRDYGSAGNQVTWTFSCWVKRTTLGEERPIFAAQAEADLSSGDPQFAIFFHSTDQLRVWTNAGNAGIYTNRVFRDVGAWYHIHLKGSDSNPYFNLYINGVEETSFATDNRASYPGGNNTYNNSANPHFVGAWRNGSIMSLGMYLGNVAIVDGTAYNPTEFGETNDNGVWIPKKPDVTWGTNGCFLEFKQTGTSADASGMGADTSGEGNHMSVVGLTATDVTVDTPTNNFATMNALINSNGTLSEGNVKYVTDNSTNNYGYRLSTIGVSSGKWYCEVKYTSSSDQAIIGIRSRLATDVSHKLGYYDDDFGIYTDGRKITNNTLSSYGTSWTDGDIIGILLDLDSNKLYFAKNGTIMNSGTGIDITAASSTTTGFYFISATEWNSSGNGTFEFNFGNPSFSISSGNTDGLYGNFEYAVSSGYYALCTKRLAEYG